MFSPRPLRRRVPALASRRVANVVEHLEPRCLLAAVTVNANTVVRAVDTKWLGLNTAPWDGQMSTATTNTMVNAIGTAAVRMGGGSYVDGTWHFNLNNQSQTMGQQANFVASRNAVGMATVNYGSGSPQESAALLAYLNGDPSSTFTIGTGEQWNGSAWVNVNWQTAGYWASLRAAAPINGNPDGLNFLRLNRPQPYGFHYWDIGNEVYGSWEEDHHGHATDTLPMPAGVSRAAHDPATIVSFAKQFQTLAASIDPTISIGFDSQNTDPTQFSNWVANVLVQANDAHQNWNIGFVSDHLYMQDSGQDTNDATLLSMIATQVNPTPANPKNWVQRAQKYRTIINSNYTPAEAAGVEIMSTEHNSISSNPRKQMTSLVNGVYLADSIGSIMQTEFNGLFTWDLHNSWTGFAAQSGVYGWRNGGDYGLIGAGNVTSLPSTGVNVPYPSYFAEQIASKIVQAGGSVVQATSNDTSLGAYAVKAANGHLKLLVVNRSKSGLNNDTTGTPALNSTTFTLNGFAASAAAQMWQFGSAEDNVAKNSANGQTSLTQTNPTLSMSGTSIFTMSFPSLSMTVIDLTPVAPSAQVAAVSPNPRADGVPQFTITFNQPVTGFDLSDLSLTRDGNGSSLSGATLSSSDGGITWTLGNTAPLTDKLGSYALTLDGTTAGIAGPGGDFTAVVTRSWAMNTLTGSASGESIRLVRNGASTDYFLNNVLQYSFNASLLPSLVVNTGGGDDVLVLDFSNGNPVSSSTTIDGGSATTQDTFAVVGSSGADTATFNAASIVMGGNTITSSGFENVTFDGAGGFDDVTVNASAMVTFPTTQRLNSLVVNGTLISAPSGSSGLGILTKTLTVTGLLDLTDNDLILDYNGTSQLSAVEASIVSARNGGTWLGASGLTSTTARDNPQHNTTLGAMERPDYPGGSFDGENPDATSVLVKYTYYGDANFSGTVSFDDYVKIDTGFNQHLTGWSNGDFNLDGSVNFDDYVLIDTAFNTQGASLGHLKPTPGQSGTPRRPGLTSTRA